MESATGTDSDTRQRYLNISGNGHDRCPLHTKSGNGIMYHQPIIPIPKLRPLLKYLYSRALKFTPIRRQTCVGVDTIRPIRGSRLNRGWMLRPYMVANLSAREYNKPSLISCYHSYYKSHSDFDRATAFKIRNFKSSGNKKKSEHFQCKRQRIDFK